ncbi:hypothetical protein BG004_005391 [Podila humilis]|nr:hypothetical protein BG004_005391 [Podila humilis]
MSAIRSSLFAAAPAVSRGQGVHLDVDPKGENLLYTNGKAVFIRNIATPELAKEYTQHSCGVTVAKYSPSGFYIASGDERGNVRIWDTVGDEQILKLETRPLGGKINDIAWDGESKRLIAVGDGKDKAINSVAIRQSRPFRAVTGGDDMSLVFSNGVPFTFNKVNKDHTRYVQEVKFSPNGDFFASVGSDGKIFLYDGKTGDKVKELSTGEHGHTGTIFALSWSADGKRMLTSSADQTAKIWDVETSSVVNTFEFSSVGDAVSNHQVGNIWKGDNLLSLSLSGDLNYLDPSTSQTSRVVKGHQKGITALTLSSDKKTLFTGSYDGRVISWEDNAGRAQPLEESSHSNQVMQMVSSGNEFISVGMDDTLRVTDISSPKNVSVISTSALPRGVSVSDDKTVVVAAENEIQVYHGNKKVSSLAVGYNATSVAINHQGSTVAVGAQDNKVYIMSLDGTKLSVVHTFEKNNSAISSLVFNPDGTLVAAGDSAGKIVVYDVVAGASKTERWASHSGRVNSIKWSPSGKYAVSGSLDTHVYVWSIEQPMKKVAILNAHALGVTGAAFIDEDTIISTGADACVKQWKIIHH